jgi:AraC-like DNA-binding protein
VYYYKVEDYEKALLHLNKMDEMGVETDATTQMSINIARSHVLHKLNRDREAYELMEKIVKMKDSLDYKRFLLQFSELQTRYEVNTIKTEKELQSAQLERTEAIAFGLVGISLSFLTLIVITRRNKKNREKRNRIIYGQYEQMKSYLDQIRTQRHEQEISRQEKKKESVNWAERATCYLVETEMFKVNDLSRDDLAIALGTNRQYLINAIKEETGKTFKDYINTIRIEYAYDMLVKDWTASIESIYLEAGFSTRSTFNRLFKQRYGFSPVEMREVVMQKEEYLMLQAEKLKSGN